MGRPRDGAITTSDDSAEPPTSAARITGVTIIELTRQVGLITPVRLATTEIVIDAKGGSLCLSRRKEAMRRPPPPLVVAALSRVHAYDVDHHPRTQ